LFEVFFGDGPAAETLNRSNLFVHSLVSDLFAPGVLVTHQIGLRQGNGRPVGSLPQELKQVVYVRLLGGEEGVRNSSFLRFEVLLGQFSDRNIFQDGSGAKRTATQDEISPIDAG